MQQATVSKESMYYFLGSMTSQSGRMLWFLVFICVHSRTQMRLIGYELALDALLWRHVVTSRAFPKAQIETRPTGPL